MASFNPNDRNILKKPTLIRNITTGITRAGKELIRDYSPEAINIYDKNKKFIAENRGAFKVNASDINNNFVFKTGKQLLKNAMTELKTGNFYDKERKEAAMNDAMSAMLGVDLNDLFDDWDIDKDDNITKSNVIEDTRKNSNAEIYNKTTTNLVTTNTSVKPAVKSISNMTKIFMDITNKSFSSVNVQLNRRVEFESTSRLNYYNSAIENMSNLSNSLSIISSNMEKLSNIEIGGLKVTTSMNQLSTLLDSRELLTIDYYKTRLGKKELSDSTANPIINGIKNVMKLTIPKVMKNILGDTADIIKTFPLLLNQKFKNWSNDLTKPVKALAGSFLHKDPSKVNYSKGPVAWDGIARRSVVSVIPELLSKYYNIVKKGKSRDEMIYDYAAGGWRNARDIKRAAYGQYNDEIINNKDINKFRMNAMMAISSRKPSDIKELNRTIRRLVEDKGMPSKNKKYSNNERINKAVLDTWLSMDGKGKSAFLLAINSIMTPEEWISNNESFHSLSGIITSVDDLIDEKDEKKFKNAMHDYLISKGNTKLANLFKEKKSSVDNMHKFNPFKYVAKGMEWLNTSVLEIMIGDEKINKKSYNTNLGKSIKDKMKSMFNEPFSEHINIIKETLKKSKNSDESPLMGAGLGLNSASFEFITEMGENINSKTKGLKEKLLDKVFKPMIDLVRESIVKPMEKAFTKVGSAISNFFGSFSKFFNTYKDKRRKNIDESHANVNVNDVINENDNTFNEMKREEFKANKESRTINNEGKDRFSKIELLLISKNALLMTSIRNGLNKPVNNLKKSVKNIIESNNKISNEKDIKGNEIILFGSHLENISINMKKLSNIESSEDGNDKINPMDKIREVISKFKDKRKDKKESIVKEPKKKKERKPKKEDKDESVFSYFSDGVKAKSKSIINKWLYTDNFKEPPITDKLKSLGFKIGDTTNTMANTIVESGTKITKDILHIKDNLVNTSKAFISSIPELGSKMFESASNVGRKLTNELKDLGKSSWNELKTQTSRIWGGAKDIFATGYNKLLGIFNDYKGGTFDVILDSGKLDGIRNIIKIVKPRKSSYEEMKDKFANESADDAKDIANSLEDGNTSRSTIFKRIKDRAERMTNGIISKIKEMAKNGAQSVFNSVAGMAGGVAGRFTGSIIGKGIDKIKGLIRKGKARTVKGKGNIGKIFGEAMDSRNAMKVYIVGGSLDGGLADGVLDDIGNISDMLNRKKRNKNRKIKRVSKTSGNKLSKGKNLGKGAKKLRTFSKADTGIAVVDTATGAIGAIGDATTIFSKNSTKTEKISSGISLADTAKDAYTTAKLGKTAISAIKGAKTAKNVAAGISAAGAGAGALAAGGSILATGGAILVPLAGAWLTDRVFKGLEGWGKAGEIFQTENPTLGMKVSSMAGSFLDSILPGDQSSWTRKIHSGTGKLKDGIVKGVKTLYKYSPIGIATGVVKNLISRDNQKEESITDKAKSISGRVLQGKSSILTSLMALTNPIGYLSYKHMKKYRDFKSKENGLEKQFLSRLTPEEREEYLANKNASLFGALLRGNSGFKFIKTILASGILSLGEGISSEEGLTVDQAKNMISSILNEAGINTEGVAGNSSSGVSSGGVQLSGGDFVGRISAKYEVGEKGNGGYISTGVGDAGGKSYGISQFTSAGGGGSANSFVSWLKTEYPSLGGYFTNAGKAGSASFDSAWTQAYNADPTGFTAAQSRYTVETQVEPFNNKSKATLNLDWYRSRALQESAYSTAVQFGAGGAMQVAKKAGINGGMDDVTIVKKFYAEKRNSVGTYKFLGCSANVRNGVRNRFINEEKDILALIGQPAGSFGIGSSAQPSSNQSTPQTARSITGRSSNGPSATTNLDKARKAASTNYTELNTIKTAIDNSPISNDDPSITLLTEMIALLADITDDTQEAAENTNVKKLDGNDKEAKSLLI